MERRKQQTTKGRALCLVKANKELNFPSQRENRKCEQWKTELSVLTDSNFLPFVLLCFILDTLTTDFKEKVSLLILNS